MRFNRIAFSQAIALVLPVAEAILMPAGGAIPVEMAALAEDHSHPGGNLLRHRSKDPNGLLKHLPSLNLALPTQKEYSGPEARRMRMAFQDGSRPLSLIWSLPSK